MIVPRWDSVAALYCLTNSMMLTPWGPSAVPTGGAGVACPAATCSFTIAAIALAIAPCASVSLQLQVVELDRGGPPEQGHRHPHLALVGDHLFHRPREVGERALGDLHHLADQERDQLLRLFLFHRLLDAEQPVHLFGAQRHRLPAGAHELDHALDAVDRVERLLVLDHLHEHVPGIDLALHRHLLAVLDLHHLLGGDEGLPDRLLPVGACIVRDAPRHQRTDLVLVPRGRLDGVPAVLRHQNHFATATTKICCSSQSIHPINSPRTATKMTITVVAFLSSSHVGHVTLRISPCTSRRKSTSRPGQARRGVASASVATATSTLCAAGACCSAGSTSSTPPAPSACAGSSS